MSKRKQSEEPTGPTESTEPTAPPRPLKASNTIDSLKYGQDSLEPALFADLRQLIILCCSENNVQSRNVPEYPVPNYIEYNIDYMPPQAEIQLLRKIDSREWNDRIRPGTWRMIEHIIAKKWLNNEELHDAFSFIFGAYDQP
jgi:hypothetical protein